jgi:hypothetical protein
VNKAGVGTTQLGEKFFQKRERERKGIVYSKKYNGFMHLLCDRSSERLHICTGKKRKLLTVNHS